MMSDRDRAGRSPLHYAAVDGDVDQVRELIEQGYDVNEPDSSGFTPLHFAAQSQAVEITRILLDHGAEINAVNRFGNSPISVAIMSAAGRLEEIALLRDRGADIYLKNNYGISAIGLVHTIANFDYTGLFPGSGHPPALTPEDLGEFFIARANAGDVEGLVALYEPDAVLALPAGLVATGHDEIRRAYTDLLASRPAFTSAGQRPAIRNGDLALTSTRLPDGGTTVEVARRQSDGTWLWVIDQPALLSA